MKGPLATDLDWQLLKRVSRSFYLTLRLLPGEVREPIALAYLLARLSDTQADGAVTDAERELLGREGELRALLAKSEDRADIEKVWTTIREGQRFDEDRFRDPAPLTSAELDRYTYLVAGCVGEFWTVLCHRRMPGCFSRPVDEMLRLGVRFGQGLQLVNILRDRAEDAARGRIYVPESDRAEAFRSARQCLQEARQYAHAVRNWRLRVATALPLLLGEETLDLIEVRPDEARVKIPRSRVWLHLSRAVVFS